MIQWLELFPAQTNTNQQEFILKSLLEYVKKTRTAYLFKNHTNPHLISEVFYKMKIEKIADEIGNVSNNPSNTPNNYLFGWSAGFDENEMNGFFKSMKERGVRIFYRVFDSSMQFAVSVSQKHLLQFDEEKREHYFGDDNSGFALYPEFNPDWMCKLMKKNIEWQIA